MTTRAIGVVFFFLLLAGCASRMPMANTLTETAEATVEEREELELGRSVVVTQCTACHRQFWPDEYSPRGWAPIAKTMSKRATLSKTEASALYAYMATASRHYHRTD